MREQFLGQLVGPRDRHRRGRRQLHQQVVDLLHLDAHARMHPGLGHQRIVFRGQVDGVDQVAIGIEQATGAGEEHDLVRLQDLDQFVGRPIGVDVEDLAANRLPERGDDRNRARPHRRQHRVGMDSHDFPDQAVAFGVQRLGFEHARGDRGGAHALRLQGLDQMTVLLLRHPAHDRQRRGIGDAQSVHGAPLDAGGDHRFVQLRAGAVDDDRRQPDLLQEGKRGHQGLQFVAQDRAADLDHGEARGIELGEPAQVLLDLLRAAHVGQQPDDGGPDIVHRGPPMMRRKAAPTVSSCSSATHSSEECAWAMSPGP